MAKTVSSTVSNTATNTIENIVLSDQALERIRVRRVPLGDNLVFLFEQSNQRTLSCTLLLEGETPELTSRWMEISRQIYLRTPGNQVIRANQISASVLNGTTSPVQHLVFDTEGQVPISIGCDDPELMLEVYFPFEVLRALCDDMGAKSPPILDFAF